MGVGKLSQWSVAQLAVVVALAIGCGGSGPVTPPSGGGGNPNVGVDAGSVDSGPVDAGPVDAGVDAGAPDAGHPDAGHPDSGTPDAGIDAGTPDAGAIDAGTPDAGAIDAGTPDAGSDGGVITFGTPGPWPTGNVTYGAAEGIQESPVVGVTTDEPVTLPGSGAKVTQNLWVATHDALYLLRPGESKFHRFDGRDGLHLPGYPEALCDDVLGTLTPCPFGYADAPGISEIVGGRPNEVFVGYYGHHDWNSGNLPDGTPIDGSSSDPFRHSGMLERVRLRADGSIEVIRFDMVSGKSTAYWHNRTIERMIYDHFIHKHELYVGTDHGVDKLSPDLWTAPKTHEFGVWTSNNRVWMSDHLHAQACYHHPCGDAETDLRLGDWRGLAFASNGDLWTGGRWAAGEIIYTADNAIWFDRGGKSFAEAFGDPYSGNCSGSRPVFCVPQEGDFVNLTATAVTKDPNKPGQDKVWFSSGIVYGDAGDVNYGVAAFLAHPAPTGEEVWTYFDPVRDIGMSETNVRDMIAMPDGKLVFAGPSTGLTVWDPVKKTRGYQIRAGRIPSDNVLRLELDTMVNPPALHVSTDAGAAVLRNLSP